MTSPIKEYIVEITGAAHEIAHLIRSLNGDMKNNYTSWNIATTAAHLVISQRMTRHILQGEKNPYRNAKPEIVEETNAQLLAKFEERNPAKLATMLVMETENVLKKFMTFNQNKNFRTHFGSMDAETFLSYNLCHLLLHGSQISRTLNKPVLVTEQNAMMTLPFLKKAMLATYDKEAVKDFYATFAIHLTDLESFVITCNNEKITISEHGIGKVDCHITTDAKTFFLVATGLENQWHLLLKGKVRVWGRKPWLALKLTTLFKSP